jgi:hypothetical protein
MKILNAFFGITLAGISAISFASDLDSDAEMLRDLINQEGVDLYASPAAPKLFVKPTHPKGLRLDWCKKWASNCGKPAADEFCKRKGFSKSSANPIDPHVGLTRVLQDDRMVCWGQPCDSFKYIVCE